MCPLDMPTDRDAAVRATDDEAAMCRLSAANVGLIDDCWAPLFVDQGQQPHCASRGRRSVSGGNPGGAGYSETRRSPIINKGTYLRTHAIDDIVRRFAASATSMAMSSDTKAQPRAQVLSLGAGCDTRHLRLLSKGSKEEEGDNVMAHIMYFEIDQVAVVAKKKALFRSILESGNVDFARLPAYAGFSDSSDGGAKAAGYRLIAADLRHWETAAARALSAAGFDPLLPTLVISECALVYLDISARDKILGWLREHVSTLSYIEYTMVNPDDAFGRMMVKNLRARGIEIPSVAHLRDPESHVARLRNELGFEHAEAVTAREYVARVLGDDEKRRAMRIEPLDEVEEWELMLGHYVLVYAANPATARGQLAVAFAKQSDGDSRIGAS